MQIALFCNTIIYTETHTMKRFLLLTVATVVMFISCNSDLKKQSKNEVSGDLIVFHAGSLAVPFKQISKEFMNQNPLVNILLESAGSIKCARKITDLNRECDIMASADYTVIDEMLIPDHASWNIKFASNEMCIVYHDASNYASEINEDNWYEILLKEDVYYGRSEPNSDPCGYRAVIVSKLAESYYSIPDFSKKLISKDNRFVRPKEVDLLALLETNTIDYIFLYRSVAEQHDLKYLILPNDINLKTPELASFYNTAKVEITGKKPGEVITKQGEPMVYGITIPSSAPNKTTALAFMKFLLKKENGMAIMEKNGQPSIVPSISSTFNNIPAGLQKFAVEK